VTTATTTEDGVLSPTGLPQALLETAFLAAVRAGQGLLEQRASITSIETKSTENDWVSEADRSSERLIADSIRATRPRDGQIGEEGTRVAGSTGLTWNFDPLDGTVNYLYGSDAWCVSIACADESGTLVGVVHEPVANRTYWATRGGGAFLNGRPLAVRRSGNLRRSLVSTGFSYDPDLRRRQGELIADLLGECRDIRRNGSAALSLCHVGSGEVDAYLECPINLWDISAASLIASEAGAQVGVAPFESALSVVAAAPDVYAEIGAVVAANPYGPTLFPHLAGSEPVV